LDSTRQIAVVGATVVVVLLVLGWALTTGIGGLLDWVWRILVVGLLVDISITLKSRRK